jgi:glutathione-independent formaldehyde dehydrogenase
VKAVVYHGPRNVSVDEVPDAKIEKPTDALVRITATNICGSDLHMYEGRTDFEAGRVFGHENVGEVIAVGDAVDKIKVGDMISAPFNVACGHCRNCEEGLTNYCLRANKPGIAGAAYGFADMGPYGSGPVGCMAALSAATMGASKVMVVDRHPDRLRLIEQIGAIGIDDSKGSPVDQVMEHTNGMGADRGAECVGYQAHDPRGHEDNSATLNDLVSSVRFTGGIGTVGVYVPQDPGGPNELAKHGKAPLDVGSFWFRGQHMGTGQCPVKRYNRYLRSLIAEDKVKPSWIVSHDLPLDQAPEAYKHFDAREEGWTKVILHPGQAT